jgi:hypothetical protein
VIERVGGLDRLDQRNRRPREGVSTGSTTGTGEHRRGLRASGLG